MKKPRKWVLFTILVLICTLHRRFVTSIPSSSRELNNGTNQTSLMRMGVNENTRMQLFARFFFEIEIDKLKTQTETGYSKAGSIFMILNQIWTSQFTFFVLSGKEQCKPWWAYATARTILLMHLKKRRQRGIKSALTWMTPNYLSDLISPLRARCHLNYALSQKCIQPFLNYIMIIAYFSDCQPRPGHDAGDANPVGEDDARKKKKYLRFFALTRGPRLSIRP